MRRNSIRAAAVLLALTLGLATLAGCGAEFRFAENRRFYTNTGQNSEVLESYARTPAQVMTDTVRPADAYPVPGKKFAGENASEANRKLIYEENKRLMEDSADAIAAGRLKKHPAADGQFDGTVPDDAPAVSKRITVKPPYYDRTTQWSTGVHAPAGEVVTVKVPQAALDAAAAAKKEFQVVVGLWNGSTNMGENFHDRMPVLSRTFPVTGTETRVGTPFGGTVYFGIGGFNGAPFDIVVEGGVESPEYTLGVTTDAEWQRLRNAPGLYAELRAGYVRFLVPSKAVRNIEDLRPIMEFWDKASSLSARAMGIYNRVITMSYDYYVAAGAAVAFVGAWFCMLPTGWAASSLNYESMMKSGGWGSLHELNHHYQGTYRPGGGWGMDGGGEVTNNVINAMTYILYTDIASYRTEDGGLSGWNYVTDPYTNLNKCLSGDTSLSRYVALIHSFGVDKMLGFIDSYYNMADIPADIDANRGSADQFCYRASRFFGQDMTAFCEGALKLTLSDAAKAQVAALKLSPYVPVANLYTSGTEGVTTGRPFTIPAGQTYTFRFLEKTACPEEVTDVKVGGFRKGKLKKVEPGVYEYTPPKRSSETDDFTLEFTLASGKTVTLSGTVRQDANTVSGARYDNLAAKNYDEAVAEAEGKAADATYHTKTAGVPNYNLSTKENTVKSLAVTEGKIVPAVTGTYTLYLRADDAAKLYLSPNERAEEAMETLFVDKYISGYQEAYKAEVPLTAGKAYYFKIVNFNAGGQGGARLGWREPKFVTASPGVTEDGEVDGKPPEIDGSTEEPGPLTDVPAGVLYALHAEVGAVEEAFTTPYYYAPRFHAETGYDLDRSGMSVISAPTGTKGADPQAMLDGNASTFYHTEYNGAGVPAFPHEYVLDLGGQKAFNRAVVVPRRASTDSIGDFELLAGDTPDKLSVVAKGSVNANNLDKVFPTVTARYFAVRALNNRYGYKYTVISEIRLGSTLAQPGTYRYNSGEVNFSGAWEEQAYGEGAGESNKGVKLLAGTGTAEFAFEGTSVVWYAKRGPECGVAEVSLDGGKWELVTLTNQAVQFRRAVYSAEKLAPGRHTLRIRATSGSTINVDQFGVTAQTDYYAHDSGSVVYRGDWHADTHGSFANGAAFAGTGTAEFTFVGTAFGWYAKTGPDYGVAEVSVDGGDWQVVTLTGESNAYQKLVYAVTDLAEGKHTVKVRAKSGAVNVDYFAVRPGREHGLGGWWVLIGFGIAAVAAGAALLVIALVKNAKKARA